MGIWGFENHLHLFKMRTILDLGLGAWSRVWGSGLRVKGSVHVISL